jgi:hypothetical protein
MPEPNIRRLQRLVDQAHPATTGDRVPLDDELEQAETERPLAVLPPPAPPGEPASPKQREEMETLLKAVVDNPTAKTIGAVLAKRPWLRRGKTAFEAYVVADDCPPEERPFFDFFDQVHSLVLEHMVKASDHKREGDGRLWLDFLGRLWPSEYSKWASDKSSEGAAIIILQGRPSRDLPPEHFAPDNDEPEPDLAA